MKSNSRRIDVGAKLTVVWGAEATPHTIILTPRNWRRVKSGKPLTIRGSAYIYDGDVFREVWRFNGSIHELVVEYEYPDGDTGTGYNGSLGGLDIVEGPYRAGAIRARTASR